MRTFLLFSAVIFFSFSLISCSEDADEQPCNLMDASFSFSLSEHTADGIVVGDVALPDVESVSYSLVAGNEENAFALNSATGKLTVTDEQKLDFETLQNYELIVAAAANSCSPAEVTVNISITNILEPFVDQRYETVTVQKDLMYGDDPDQNMWIYSPDDHTEAKLPVMVIAGGGSFSPSNLDVLETLATRIAKAGYLVATIRYHVDPDVTGEVARFERSVIGSHDIKAAIRFFRKDAANDNLYKADAANIFVGGHGTGAFLAFFATYGQLDDIPSPLQPLITELGGIDGSRGNEGYASHTNATLALSGAVIGDLTLIDAGENPAVMIHGLQDVKVPCEEAEGNFGSCLVADRMDEVGISNRLILMPDGNHQATQYCISCIDEALSYLSDFLE